MNIILNPLRGMRSPSVLVIAGVCKRHGQVLQLSHTLRMVERSTSLFLRPYFDSSQTVEGHVSREGARCSHTQAAPQSDQLCPVMREHSCAARFVKFV